MDSQRRHSPVPEGQEGQDGLNLFLLYHSR